MMDPYGSQSLESLLTDGPVIPVTSSTISSSSSSNNHLHHSSLPSTLRQNNSSNSITSGGGSSTATPVISLFKLKNFLYQPKFKPPFAPSSQSNVQNSQNQQPQSHNQTSASNYAQQHSNNSHSSNSEGNGPTGDENRVGLDSSVHHSLYGSHGSGRLINTGGSGGAGGGHSGSQSMLLMPQPMKSLSSSNTTNGSGRKYSCKMCPQIFTSKADMQLHTQIHMREAKPYKCNQCSKAFANSSYLSQHTRIHLGIKPYKCEICMRKFTQLSHLQQHIRTHTGDKPYKCRHPGCNKAFSQLSNLQSHSRCHQTDKPFKCNSCYKCFVDEASLLEHIPKHKESKHLKTHICEFCGKSYTQETYLAKHMAKHADRMDKRGLLMRSSNASLTSLTPHSVATSGVNTSADHYWNNNKNDPLCNPSDSGVQHQHQPQDQSGQLPLGLSSDGRYSGHSNGRSPEDMMYSQEQKSSSAFTPIQPMITSQASARSVAAYFPYESFGFPSSKTSVSPMEAKAGAGHTAFPNQLIALHQIRNYASMPGSASSLADISAKDKQPSQ